MMTVEDLLAANKITGLKSTAHGRYYTTCPRCSAKRSKAHQREKVLGVTIDADGASWGCNHCGWTGPAKGNGAANGRAENVITYDYVNENGVLLFQKVRGANKKFWQRKPDGRGRWINKLGDTRKVIYRLPDVNEAIAAGHTVVVVEGEKDADNLWRIGVPATCNPDGASEPGKTPKWRPEYSELLRGADIIIMGDNDPAGRAHVEATASMSVGIAARVRVLDLAKHWSAIPHGGDISDWLGAGHSREELDALIERAPDYGVAPAATLAERDAGDDTGPIPPRRWLLGNQFCRKFVSSLIAPGATGKSALRLLQFISLATGRALTGQHVFRRCRVLLLSFEDDLDELHRRIAAALIHHRIDRSEIKEWFFYAAPKGIKLAEMVKGSRQIGQLEKLLREAIARRKADIVGLDPFIKLHALEENDNGAMDFVCDLLTTLAIELDIAVDVPHHAKKGNQVAGDADAGRGASGIRDAGRLVYTLTRMSQDEATAFDIKEADRAAYVRLDSAKVNIVPSAQNTTWFKLVSVRLDNGTAEYPNGDEVQTVEPWSPPKTWANLSNFALNAALTEIDSGMPNGRRYSGAASARTRAAWPVVQRHCSGKTESQCREIIKTWLMTGALYNAPYDDPIDRKEVDGLYVNAAKRPGTEVEP
jgi:AAA domain